MFPGFIKTEIQGIAFDKVQNAFTGILCGIIGSSCYNRFKGQKLPDFLAFFSGRRFVAIVTAGVSILVSIVLLFVLPILYKGFFAFGEAIVKMGPVGAGLYAFFNRLLIPFGLHHALNNVFWFDTVGLGDLVHFWAGDVTGVNGVTWDLGMYMSGFFPCMMFGVSGAALAMYLSAKNEKKKAAGSLLLSSALAAFLCGVTEPFEFSFMFAAFPLYVLYAALYGLFTVITCYVGFRAGFSFSAGLTDLIFSASLPAARKTLMIIPLGIAAFAVFFGVFWFCIRKFSLKTPGREDEDASGSAASAADASFAESAKKILAALGGRENIEHFDYCVTRLRVEVKDESKVNEQACRSAGALGVFRPGKNAVQVVLGPQVQFVYDEMKKILNQG
jgi:PTS system N-acetylglucosamine-specific IIC component